jgi:hypothetical protein
MMTGQQTWKDEVEEAISSGLSWRLVSVWFAPMLGPYSAELAHTRTGRRRVVTVSPQAFATPAARREEILRQLEMSL